MIVIFDIMLAYPSFATTMCAVNDSVAIVLDPQINASGNHAFNAITMTWNVPFPYGPIYGIAACVDKGGTTNQATTHLTATDGTVVTGSFDTTGQYCWCKITHPVSSRWVFNVRTGSASACASNCALYCGSYVRSNAALRGGLFGSIAQ